MRSWNPKSSRKRDGPGAFLDPNGYLAYIADRNKAFLAEWNRQKK